MTGPLKNSGPSFELNFPSLGLSLSVFLPTTPTADDEKVEDAAEHDELELLSATVNAAPVIRSIGPAAASLEAERTCF